VHAATLAQSDTRSVVLAQPADTVSQPWRFCTWACSFWRRRHASGLAARAPGFFSCAAWTRRLLLCSGAGREKCSKPCFTHWTFRRIHSHSAAHVYCSTMDASTATTPRATTPQGLPLLRRMSSWLLGLPKLEPDRANADPWGDCMQLSERLDALETLKTLTPVFYNLHPTRPTSSPPCGLCMAPTAQPLPSTFITGSQIRADALTTLLVASVQTLEQRVKQLETTVASLNAATSSPRLPTPRTASPPSPLHVAAVDATDVAATDVDATDVDATDVDAAAVDAAAVDAAAVDAAAVDAAAVDATDVDATDVDVPIIDMDCVAAAGPTLTPFDPSLDPSLDSSVESRSPSETLLDSVSTAPVAAHASPLGSFGDVETDADSLKGSPKSVCDSPCDSPCESPPALRRCRTSVAEMIDTSQ
jgi:hypothetical protein